ncbi:MAG: hypothetical protein EB127_00950 [Alphaproteobacteria bacterium]|nr:hypothetical protein [Alphaproteobacteria bacterium]
MGKYDSFLKNNNEEDYEELHGYYGCQTCPEDLFKAYFDEANNTIFWTCSEGHRSEIKVGV